MADFLQGISDQAKIAGADEEWIKGRAARVPERRHLATPS